MIGLTLGPMTIVVEGLGKNGKSRCLTCHEEQ